ncbi:MAG: Radical SAM domain protein [Methanoculleus marisnigri]|uniref:Radical SAM domain protein n=1 Tax=Methanoculleus marisnigri TaxID=2198 RepID=A0A101GSM3_9EURY|nr:SynChlorMet cassette radical SAM/SPASM protein ScmE [Methanoculleus marisnigri]KUK63933.1 MAG: Radical SAM domain protein [Methanoculleus marisnigri]
MIRIPRTPRSVDIAITNRCNLKCAYCSHFTSAGDVTRDLPTEDWFCFIEELGDCTVMRVTLEGGEAFMRRDLPEIIDAIGANRMRFAILSNGTLVTDDIATHLAATGRCDGVQVSIDGSRPETHDSCRGSGTFAKAVRGIGILREHGLPVPVRVTLHQHNVRNLEGIAAFLLDELGLPSFSTNAASYLGLCRSNAAYVQLTVEDRVYAMETLLRLNEEYNGRISAQAGPLADARMWTDMEKMRADGAPGFRNGCGFLASCSGPYSKLAVRADGVFVPCLQLPHIELGTINRDSLKGVWQMHPALDRLRERSSIPLSSFESCRRCEYLPYCRGGCPALAYTLTGEAYGPAPDGCLKRFLEDGGRLPE